MKAAATILVADDDASMRAVLSDILSAEGFRVLQAGDGNQALELINQDQPDVILLDIRMPRMDGLAAIRRIKGDSLLKHIPVVIVTGLDDTRARLEALGLGADDFLLKPVHMAELQARVRSLVKVKAYHDHLLHYQQELESRVERRTRDLRMTMSELAGTAERLKQRSLNTILCLSRAAEYKDEDTASHIQRIGRYSEALGKRLGLSDGEQEMLLYATPMHDIGKIGIPDRILLKPGKLDPDEWKIMQQHTVFGAQMLAVQDEDDGFLKMAREIASSHHEKWDGSGSPAGLREKAIPLPGRITAVADVFDALSSKRPYKEACPLEESFRFVAQGAGIHFDPELVAAFVELKEDIFAIRLPIES